MDNYHCERCKKWIVEVYEPPYFSALKNSDAKLEDRLLFICAKFYMIESPFFGFDKTLYLCHDCKKELNIILKKFFELEKS